MQLSITFLVSMILAISIFAFGLFMVREFYGFATEAQAKVDLQTQKEIERRLFEGGQKVAVPINKATISRRESHTFGLGILNTLGEAKTFPVQINYVFALTPDQKERVPAERADQGYINSNWVRQNIPPFKLNANEHQVIPLTVLVGGRMSDADATLKNHVFVFNVCVFKPNQIPTDPNACGQMKYGPDLNRLYDGKVHKIYVTVN